MDDTIIYFTIGAAAAGLLTLAWPIVARGRQVRRRAAQTNGLTVDQRQGSVRNLASDQTDAHTRDAPARSRASAGATATGEDSLALLPWIGLLGGPFLILVLIEIGVLDIDGQVEVMYLGGTAALGFLAPTAWISALPRQISARHRRAFPDILDWILICIDSGLGFEDAIDRVAHQAVGWDRRLGADWIRLSGEIKAGRPVSEALAAFADRVAVPDIAVFASTLGQWRELGVSVSAALRGHVEDFRERRLIEAENAAQKLPAKLVLPIGILIFPVILVMIMLPALLNILALRF